jgi:hypothetical protein
VRARRATGVWARVERNVGAHRIGQSFETIDPEIGAKDTLQRDPTDASTRETREVLESDAAETG